MEVLFRHNIINSCAPCPPDYPVKTPSGYCPLPAYQYLSVHEKAISYNIIPPVISEEDLKVYLSKISDEALYSYNVYQIEGEGRNLFLNIEGDEDTIMGLPVKKIREYLEIAQ